MRVLLFSAVAAAALASAGPADACTCPGYANRPVINPQQDSPLPTNGRVLVRDDVIDPRIYENTPSATEIPAHMEPAGGNFVWLVLDQDLEPATQYKVTSTKGVLTTFNAFSGPDTMPPQLASAEPSSSRVSGDCFDVELVRLSVAAGDDLGLSLVVKVEIDTPKEESVLFFTDKDVSFISADQPSDCFAEAPDTVQGTSYAATVTAYDRAGNPGVPIAVKLDFPKQPDADEGCGCRVAGAPGRPSVAGALLLVLGGLAVGRGRLRARLRRSGARSDQRARARNDDLA